MYVGVKENRLRGTYMKMEGGRMDCKRQEGRRNAEVGTRKAERERWGMQRGTPNAKSERGTRRSDTL